MSRRREEARQSMTPEELEEMERNAGGSCRPAATPRRADPGTGRRDRRHGRVTAGDPRSWRPARLARDAVPAFRRPAGTA